jgi:hypothetical protein
MSKNHEDDESPALADALASKLAATWAASRERVPPDPASPFGAPGEGIDATFRQEPAHLTGGNRWPDLVGHLSECC